MQAAAQMLQPTSAIRRKEGWRPLATRGRRKLEIICLSLRATHSLNFSLAILNLVELDVPAVRPLVVGPVPGPARGGQG